MQKKRLLQDIGLNAYEAAAYLSLLKLGVSEASAVCKDSDVPYGKVYTVLESLSKNGFVEVQASRPKKFRAIDPDTALDDFFEIRKSEIEREVDILKGSVKEAKNALKAVPAKIKILIALAVVASKQCERCTVVQMQSALKNGATKEEIMEVMDVIFITSGAPAVAACRDALKLLK